MTGHSCAIFFAAILLCVGITGEALANDSSCRVDDMSGGLICTGLFQSIEQQHECGNTGNSPACNTASYPTIKWTVTQSGASGLSMSVIVDPAPDPARQAALTTPGERLEDYTLAGIKMTYREDDAKAQNFDCRPDQDGYMMCEISTQFIDLKCNGQDKHREIGVQATEIYQKDGAGDLIYKNRSYTFDAAGLARDLCDARLQVTEYDEAQQNGPKPKQEP